MGLASDMASGIRSLLRRDKERVVLKLAQGSTSATIPGSSYDLMQSYGYDVISDYLKLEQDLMSRFIDYESMDDYDILSTILDIYGDDATQPDTPTNKRVWFESPDKDMEMHLNDWWHKQLRGDEEIWEIARSACKYGNCVREGSRVWTEHGSVPIERVEPGTRVFGYKDGSLELFTVRQRYCNGVQQTYRVRTQHREVFVTANHPLLVQDVDGTTRWVQTKDLKVSRYAPSPGRGTGGLRPDNPKLVVGTRSRFPEVPPSWAELLEPGPIRTWGAKGSPHVLSVPESFSPWISRLLGFLWGDGFLGSEDPYSTSTSVFYARGEYADQNDYYDALLARFGIPVHVSEDGCYTSVSSVQFKDFLQQLSWCNGASAKRLPAWLGRLPRVHQEEFLHGFLDADGWTSSPRTWTRTAHHFEIANVQLAYDLKSLVDRLGYRSGQVRVRHRQPGFEIQGKLVQSTQPTGMLTFSFLCSDDDFQAENLLSVEPLDEAPVYDLEVDDEAHNFIVEGVVVHNSYEELVIHPEDGVVALNHLPAATVRRVEGPRGELYGFVQDFNRRVGYSPQEFQGLLRDRIMGAQGGLGANEWGGHVKVTGNENVVALEGWQVAHFRLRSKQRKSVYGYCLAGDSRVWTTKGLKAIEDVRAGDRVLHRKSGMLRSTPIVDQVCSGTKPLFKLQTEHRELRLTDEHPVLRWHGGTNNQWVQVKDLAIGDRICIATHMPQMHGSPAFGLQLLEVNASSAVRFTERGASALRERTRVSSYAPRDEGLRTAASSLGITRGQLDELLEGRSCITRGEAEKFFQAVELPFFQGAVDVVSDARLTLPDFITPEVARLWGFLLGDGWITDGQLYFACGENEDQNLYYERLFESFGLTVGHCSDDSGKKTQSYVSSTALVGLFRQLGWVGGAHTKRVPSWVPGASRELREAFIQGFQDADGWITRQGPEPYYHIELCNEALVRDLKNVIDGLGWVSGLIRERGARDSEYKGKKIRSGPGYLLYYRKAQLSDGDFMFEAVSGVTPDGEGPVYDIEVAGEGHNFVAEGMLVHNSVLEPARWTWKRLILLEDAAWIYRIQRAPERYAYYVDIGNRPPNEALQLLNMVRQQYKKKRFVNPTTGQLDLKYDIIAPDEDIFVPTVNGQDSTRIELLGGPNWQHMDDIEYFLKKIFGACKVPRAYLSQEEGVNRAILSSEDVRFARTILRVQRELKYGIEKIARVHLAALGIPPDRVEFDVRFTVPSAIFELAQLEVRNARADLATRMREHVSLEWILEHVFSMSDDERTTVMQQRDDELLRQGNAQGQADAAMQKLTMPPEPPMPPEPVPPGSASESRQARLRKPGLYQSVTMPSMQRTTVSDPMFDGMLAKTSSTDAKLDLVLRRNVEVARHLSEVRALVRDISRATGSKR